MLLTFPVAKIYTSWAPPGSKTVYQFNDAECYFKHGYFDGSGVALSLIYLFFHEIAFLGINLVDLFWDELLYASQYKMMK